VKTQDARNAIDALLDNREVAVKHTGAEGCSTKWSEKSVDRIAALNKIEEQPVTVELVSKAELAKLRTDSSHKLTLIDFWATWCGSCIAEFADIQDTFRMYTDQDLSLVTVSVNMPDEQESVLRFLKKKHATSRNLLFSSTDTVALQQAFDPAWDSAVPYTILLDANGKVLYKQMGSVDILELRRTILANVGAEYAGFTQYWKGN
jgi:thiol-disulfide isomerase/thioredoxin